MTATSPAPRRLTQRATLTFISRLLQQGARLVVQIVITPILIAGLGVPIYGAWLMIQQTIGYLAISDMRPMATLKFALAVRQHVDDDDEKRRMVGAAMQMWLYTLPIMIIAGVAIVWAAPYFIRVAPEHVFAVRAAMGITALYLTIDRLLSLPSNVLAGMNLEYRAMGLTALIIVVSGVLAAAAVRAGLGLIGLAGATAIGAVLQNLTRFVIARRSVGWFGSASAPRDELIAFAKLSGWVFVLGVGALSLTAADLLVLGFVFSPAVAAAYGTTAAVLRIGLGPFTDLLTSGSPGLSDMCARKEWQRVDQVRQEMHMAAVLVMCVAGASIIALNEDFLRLWTKKELFAGMPVNVLLVAAMLLMLLYRTDSIIATSMVELRTQVYLTVAAALVALPVAALSARRIGPAAVAGTLAAAHGTVTFLLERHLARRTENALPVSLGRLVRPLLTTALVFAAAVGIERVIVATSWIALVLFAAVISSAALVCILFLGFDAEQRGLLFARLRRSARSIPWKRATGQS